MLGKITWRWEKARWGWGYRIIEITHAVEGGHVLKGV